MPLVLALLLQAGLPSPGELPIGLPDPDAAIIVGGEIEGPYILRDDDGQTTKVLLKNGLTVLVRENNAVPLTSITTHVKVGYFNEPAGLSGISHLVEHMLFQETGGPTPVRETRALGASITSHTGPDRTVFQTVVPADNAVAALEVQANAVWNADFQAAALEREVTLIEQENLRRYDTPPAIVREGLYRTAFTRHRMGNPVHEAGGLRALTPEDVTGFHARYYQPSNVILVVVGRFDREEMLGEVVRVYGDVSDTPVEPDTSPPEPPQETFRYDWARGRTEEPQIAIGYHVPGVDSEGSDRYALDVLSAILTGGRASRANWFLRDERGVITSAEAGYAGFPGVGYFTIRLEAPDPDAALLAVFEELDRIGRFGVREGGLSRAKLWIARNYYQRLETVNGIAGELAMHEANGDWRGLGFYLEGIQAVTGDDIGRVVERHFGRENLSVFEYLPAASARALSSREFESRIFDQLPVNIVERSIEDLDVPAEVPLPDRDLVMDVIPPLVRRSIFLGPDVYVAEDHRLPLVSFGIFYPGGRLYESAGNAGITELMLRAALRDTRRYNTSDISRRLENAGVELEIVNEPDFHGYVLNGVSGHMADALEVLMEVLQDPTFLEDDVEREKVLQLAAIRRLREDNVAYPAQLFMETVFDDHPYARAAAGSEASVAGLTAEALADWHREHQRTVMPVIVIAGDTQGTALVSSIAETLTNDDLFERNISALPLPTAPLDAEEAEFTGNRAQSVLVYGTMVAPYGHPDRVPLEVIRNVLSGRGGRLSSSIQEVHGLAGVLRRPGGFFSRAGAFAAYAAFSPGDEGAVQEAVRGEFERLIQEGISEEEFDQAVNYSAGVRDAALQTRRAKVLALARSIIFGGEASSVGNHEDLRTMDRDQLRFVAERYLSPSQSKTVIVRGVP